jgi:hypothetical protein
MIKDQVYELVLEDDMDEVFAISLVEQPAIESNFVYFNKQGVQFAAINDEKRLVMGPILVPDKKILRVDEMGNPYYVFFKPDTIKKLSQMYLEKKYNSETTLEHDKKIDNISLVESWIVESRTKDKSSIYGLSLPIGSWVGTFKVNNDDIWNNYVKTGDVKGFSIEGMFSHKLVEASMVEDIMEKEITELSDVEAQLVLKKIKNLIKTDLRYAKGKRIDIVDMEGAMPTVSTSYPGEGPTKKKKTKMWSDVFASIKQ